MCVSVFACASGGWLPSRDQSKEGEKAAEQKPLGKWEPTKEGYIQFLVDSKAVFDTMEDIVEKAAHPSCKGGSIGRSFPSKEAHLFCPAHASGSFLLRFCRRILSPIIV